jgi:hypothetical protein
MDIYNVDLESIVKSNRVCYSRDSVGYYFVSSRCRICIYMQSQLIMSLLMISFAAAVSSRPNLPVQVKPLHGLNVEGIRA